MRWERGEILDISKDLSRKLDRLLKEPENALLFNRIGVLLYQLKDWENAEKYFQRAYQLCPLNQDILYNYAILLNQQAEWRRSAAVFNAYLELNPGDSEVVQKLGDLYYQLGEYEQAAKMYEQLPKVE